jgi:hypothetical protein
MNSRIEAIQRRMKPQVFCPAVDGMTAINTEPGNIAGRWAIVPGYARIINGLDTPYGDVAGFYP